VARKKPTFIVRLCCTISVVEGHGQLGTRRGLYSAFEEVRHLCTFRCVLKAVFPPCSCRQPAITAAGKPLPEMEAL
jgi:hypothetical protein